MKKIKFINLPNDFQIVNLRNVLTEAICDKEFDFVVLSTKKCVLVEGITWDDVLEKVVPSNYLCGVSLGLPAGIALTYPPKFPMIETGMVAFASDRIRNSSYFEHFKNFSYFLHFRKWSSIEFELYCFVDFLFQNQSIYVYEQEKNVINEYGLSTGFGINKLLFYPNFGFICYLPQPNIEKVVSSIQKHRPKFLQHSFFVTVFSMAKKIVIKLKRNNDFVKDYTV